MVAHIGWLKARLTWNGLRRDRQRRIGLPLVLGLTAYISWRLATAYTTELARLNSSLGLELAHWGALALFVGWISLPVVIFPLDETLDPARLAVFPIRRHSLLSGLALASLISPSVLVPATALAVNVSVFSGWASVAALIGGIVLMAQMAVGAHLFTGAISAILRSRRGRDIAVLVVIGIGLFTFGAYQTISHRIAEVGLAGALAANPLSRVAAFIPPVAAQAVATKAAEGDVLGSLTMLVVALGWLGLLALAWSRLLGWMLVTPDHSPRPDRARHRRGFAERGLWGTRLVLARKELRFFVRDPRQRLVWTGTVIFVGLAVAVLVVGSESLETFRRSSWLPLLVPAMVLFVGLPIALNQFGWERNAASYIFALPVKTCHLLMGKNLAIGFGLLLETLFLSILLATISGAWGALLMVPALSVAAIGGQLGVGNLVSVITPLRLPREGTDVFAQATEQGFLALIAQLVSFMVIGLLLVPPSVAVALTVSFGQAVSPIVATLFCIAYGSILYLSSLWLAGVLLRRRVPEVVAWVQVH